MTITHKLIATFAFFITAMLVLLATLTLSAMRVNDRVQSITEQTLVVMNHLISMSTAADMIALGFELDHPPFLMKPPHLQSDTTGPIPADRIEHITTNIANLENLLNAYSQTIDAHFPDEGPLRDDIASRADALLDTARWLSSAHSGITPFTQTQMHDRLTELLRHRSELLVAIDAASVNEQSEIKDRLDNVRDAVKTTNMAIWSGFFALTILVVIIAIFITRHIVSRIASLRAASLRVGAGDLTAYVVSTSNDEIGELAQAFNTMAEQLADTMARRDAAKKELRAFNERLETLVRSRTEEFKLAKENAESANRAKSKFLSSMSHELRTPLNAIMGFAQMLNMDALSNKDRDEYVSIIIDNGRILLAEIDQLLVLSKLADAEIEVQIERHPVALNDALSTAITQATHLARGYGVKLINNTDRETLPWVLAREEHLNAILSNLLSNAIKYNRPENAEVVISDQRISPDVHRVIITDTGVGFKEDHPGQALEPFERLRHSGGAIDGTGVGLTIVNSFLTLIRGKLGYETSPHGSRFWIDLEVTQPPD